MQPYDMIPIVLDYGPVLELGKLESKTVGRLQSADELEQELTQWFAF